MTLTFAIALYFVIWWTLLFAVLPIGVRSQIEANQIVPGSEGAAPERPLMLMKVVITTILAAIVLAALYAVLEWKLVTLDSIPFLPRFDN